MFNNIYKDKKVVVTGNTGFKGAWLTIWLLRMGARVYGISNGVPTNPSLFENLQLAEKIEHRTADIRDFAAVREIIHAVRPDFLFHLAAQPIVGFSYTDPVGTIATNVLGTTHILESLRLADFSCNAVIITSDKCYDNVEWVWGYRESDRLGGKDPYSASKGGAELIIKTYYHSFFKQSPQAIKIVSVRAGNVIGGGDWADKRIVPDCFRAWSEGRTVTIRSPRATRPWQHVLEPLSGYLCAGQALGENNPQVNGGAYNFGPAEIRNYSVIELLREISNHWTFQDGAEKFIVEDDAGFHEAGLLKLNCDKAAAHLQWNSVLNFNETAGFTADWYDRFYHKNEDMFAFSNEQIEQYLHKAREQNLTWSR